MILTNYGLDEYVFDALRAGASGFLLKDTEPADLLQALRVAVRGDALLSPGVTRRLISEFVAPGHPTRSAARRSTALTNREREVVALVAQGLTNDEIAAHHGDQPDDGQDPRQPGDDQAATPATAPSSSSSPTSPGWSRRAPAERPDPTLAVHPRARRSGVGCGACHARKTRGRCRRHHHARRRRAGGPHDRHRRRRPRPPTEATARPRTTPRRSGSRPSTPPSTGRREGQLVTDLSTPGQRAGEDGRGDHPAQPARRAAGQRVRLRRGRRGGRAVPRQLPRGLAERRPPGALPLLLRGGVQHRHPQRLRPQQQRHDRRRRRRVRLRRLPGPVRDGGLLEVPHRLPPHPDLPALPLEGHARRDAARRPGHARAGRLVLPRGAGRLPALQQVPLGPADRSGPQDRALPGLAPDAAGVRRPRGPQRHPQLRRDPVLGRLRARRQARRRTSTTTRAGTAGCVTARSS